MMYVSHRDFRHFRIEATRAPSRRRPFNRPPSPVRPVARVSPVRNEQLNNTYRRDALLIELPRFLSEIASYLNEGTISGGDGNERILIRNPQPQTARPKTPPIRIADRPDMVHSTSLWRSMCRIQHHYPIESSNDLEGEESRIRANEMAQIQQEEENAAIQFEVAEIDRITSNVEERQANLAPTTRTESPTDSFRRFVAMSSPGPSAPSRVTPPPASDCEIIYDSEPTRVVTSTPPHRNIQKLKYLTVNIGPKIDDLEPPRRKK